MRKIFYIIIALTSMSVMHSCELLPLQTDEKYEGRALNPYTGMNCLEFLETKTDDSGQRIFTNMRKAISICELEDLYSQTEEKLTYLLLDDTKLKDSEVETAEVDTDKREALRNKLLFHVLQGDYHAYGTLSYAPTYVVTMYRSSDYVISVNLLKSDNRNQEGRFVVSYSNIKTGKESSTYAYASNYLFTNGAGHILNSALNL